MTPEEKVLGLLEMTRVRDLLFKKEEQEKKAAAKREPEDNARRSNTLGEDKERKTFVGEVKAVWLNGYRETGKPYDVCIEVRKERIDAGELTSTLLERLFVEIKATVLVRRATSNGHSQRLTQTFVYPLKHAPHVCPMRFRHRYITDRRRVTRVLFPLFSHSNTGKDVVFASYSF